MVEFQAHGVQGQSCPQAACDASVPLIPQNGVARHRGMPTNLMGSASLNTDLKQ